MRVMRVWWCSMLAAVGLLGGVVAAHAAPDVRLSEILAGPGRDWDGNGAFSSRDDEWFEIVNGGAVTVDLASYFMTDGDSVPRYGFTGTLAPGATLLVTGTASVAWERATAHPVFGLSLGNTGDRVLLWQVVGADTLLVDEYAYRTHECATDRAIGHELAQLDGMGGAIGAIEYMKSRLVESNADRLNRIERQETIVVGVNRWQRGWC